MIDFYERLGSLTNVGAALIRLPAAYSP